MAIRCVDLGNFPLQRLVFIQQQQENVYSLWNINGLHN